MIKIINFINNLPSNMGFSTHTNNKLWLNSCCHMTVFSGLIVRGDVNNICS